ncbi:MAG TPA: hypothetical protein VHM88_01360 [Candidatus Acidoferrales bacterium]|nr:hypothetical protein [Candidatus Acidoferrales bacterium]
MNLRIGLYCLLGGLSLTIPALGADYFAWWWLSGVILAAALVPVARFGPQHILGQFGAIILLLVVVGPVCTMWEAVIFLPRQKEVAGRDLAGGIVMYLIVAAVLTLLAKALKLTEPSTSTVERRPLATTALMVGLSGLTYVLYYLIFGSITYQFLTKQYYPEAQKIVSQLGLWFWVIELVRGILMTLAVLPIICTLRMRRRPAALAVGALLWIVGGATPLLVPNALMTPAQRYIHIVEILTQNASLGITAALLLRPKPAVVASLHPATSR